MTSFRQLEEIKNQLKRARRSLRDNDFDAARAAYEKVLELQPDHVDALCFLGTLHARIGSWSEAEALLGKALQLRPDSDQTLTDLGTVYRMSGRPDEALAHYQKAFAINPDNTALNMNLGALCNALGRYAQAIEHTRRALRAVPDDPGLLLQLGRSCQGAGGAEEAAACFRRLLKLGRDSAEIRFRLAACEGREGEAAALEFVKAVFDEYAPDFERHLVDELGYRAPEVLRDMVLAEAGAQARFGRVGDLGCGSGLVGKALRGHADHIAGVDLAPRMVEIAHDAGAYDELVVADMSGFLEAAGRPFDLLVAADALTYLGGLEAMFGAAHRALAPGGLFAFTCEALSGEGARGFVLQPTNRYAHGEQYLRSVAAAAGFVWRSSRLLPLRKEGTQWIDAHYVLLQRQRAAD